MRKEFSICDSCIDDVAAFKAEVAARGPIVVPMPRPFPLFESTAEFPMCAVCQNYTQTPHTVTFDVQKYHEEPCDCPPGRPQHNDGGNYHYTTWQPIKSGT